MVAVFWLAALAFPELKEKSRVVMGSAAIRIRPGKMAALSHFR